VTRTPDRATRSSDPIPLSIPHLTGRELAHVEEALDAGWVAVGPHIDRFERAFAAAIGVPHATAVASGTAALHLALEVVGVAPADEVLCSTLTFVASANPILYQGARPVFVDADPTTWNMDPALLAEALDRRARAGRRPRAVVLVHLYGQSADIDPILESCRRHGVALIEDAAEALGATYKGTAPGGHGDVGAFSFNGNKIITTGGGGMVVSADAARVARARHLANQGSDPAPHYQHSAVGYNYRMSNVAAAIGLGQLEALSAHVSRRRAVFERYREALGPVPGLSFAPEAPYGVPTRWLTVLLIDRAMFGADRESVRRHLHTNGIEARPVWKPLHLQPVFAGAERVGGTVAEDLFERGLCLPSSAQLTPAQIDRVAETLVGTPRSLRR
jgi:pyridoxal phosphate-dependent aminotransferase EpsN